MIGFWLESCFETDIRDLAIKTFRDFEKEGREMLKVGDRVRSRVEEKTSKGKIEIGEVGTVWELGRSGFDAGIKFDRNIGGHDLGVDGRSCEDGYGWYMERDNLEKIDKKETKLQFDAGVRDKVVKALKSRKSDTQRLYDGAINAMVKATTIEEILEAKKALLIGIVEGMPLGINSCYFCLVYLRGVGGCGKCPYGKVHGNCLNSESESDYKKIHGAKVALLDALQAYYKGEKYEEPRELAAGDMVTVRDGSWTMMVDKEGKMRTSSGVELQKRRLRIVETDKQGLPTNRPARLDWADVPDNDTILQDVDTGEVVFIQKAFLEKVS